MTATFNVTIACVRQDDPVLLLETAPTALDGRFLLLEERGLAGPLLAGMRSQGTVALHGTARANAICTSVEGAAAGSKKGNQMVPEMG